MTLQETDPRTCAPAGLTTLERRHLPGALKLSQEMGWPYRFEDWETAATLGQGLVLERSGTVIGTALWWTYGQDFASAGMIIVTAAEQGCGHGARLFDGLLAATEGRNLFLNSTQEGFALYRRRGFSPWAQVLQHQGPLVDAVAPDASAALRPATAEDLPALRQFDAQAAGMPRHALIGELARTGRVMLSERAGRILGYSVARLFGRGHVVGPVVADTAEAAQALILAHLAHLQGQFVRIDVYAHDGLGEWLDSLGLRRVSEATAMVRGVLPEPAGDARIFALANQSFG
ncbi:GNAT family N-acetyltransferase [Frigidibacter oleivorans]|uniref:GNAT family N-acetyltransferase n=1 Tax=Frigidibacter oleivorans TaxID=2487129 RepID=UPI000F8C3D1A|nr:GNAT family N-acetyltransferase [Frigidibacter oleivorans]